MDLFSPFISCSQSQEKDADMLEPSEVNRSVCLGSAADDRPTVTADGRISLDGR